MKLRIHMLVRAVAILAVPVLAACGDDARTAAEVERWRLQIVQSIEPAEGLDSDSSFDDVVGAVRLDDGRVVVAERGSGELLWFDAQGKALRSTAGAGDAGAFRELVGLQRIGGDSLAVFDALRLVHVLDRDGTFGRTLLLFDEDSATHSVFRLHGFFSDGATLAVGWPQPSGAAGEDSLRLRVYTPGGALAGVLGPFPAVVYDGRTRVVFSPMTSVAIVDDRIVVGYPDSFRLRVFERDGMEGKRLTRPSTARAVTNMERGWYANAFLAAADESGAAPSAELRQLRRRALQTTSFARQLPAFRRVLAGAGDQVWVEHYHPEHELPATLSPILPGPGFWSVFDLDRGWIADVEVPARVRILAIGPGLVTGVQRDPGGVERPVVLRITRDGIPSADPES